MTIVNRTKRHLRWRAIVMGAAIYFSMLPLTVTFGRDGFHGLMLEDWAARIPALALAAVLWVVYWRMAPKATAVS